MRQRLLKGATELRSEATVLRSFLRSLALTDVVIFLLAAGIWWLLGG